MLDPNYRDLLSAFLAHDVRFLVVGAYAFGAHDCPVIGAEDMLINKRAAGRAKDLADAEELERILAAKSRG